MPALRAVHQMCRHTGERDPQDVGNVARGHGCPERPVSNQITAEWR